MYNRLLFMLSQSATSVRNNSLDGLHAIDLCSVVFDMESFLDTFEALWDQTHTCLCWFIFRRVASEEDAEDILQDVFLRAYRYLESVREPERLESWIYQIARHRIIDHYRSRRQWLDLPENLVGKDDPPEETPSNFIPFVCDVIDRLSDTDREALLQSDYHGIAQQDLACELGISLSGAKSRVQRARRKVKQALLGGFDIEFDPRGGMIDFEKRCC